MSIAPSYGKLVVTISNTDKIYSSSKKLMDKNMVLNLWIVQVIVSCLIWFKNHIEIYL